jgi:hypothetical protein
VNVWIAHLVALQHEKDAGAASALVRMVEDRTSAAGPVQLAMSWEMLATLERVLDRLGYSRGNILGASAAVTAMMKAGPEQFDPYLLPEGGRHLLMRDGEDARVLASAIAARVDLLITDNLDDFAIKDAERIDTRMVRRRDRPPRQLYALILERPDGVAIVIAHPIDAVEWLKGGIRPTPHAIRRLYAPPAAP